MPDEKEKELPLGDASAGAARAKKHKDAQAGGASAEAGVDSGDDGGVPSDGGGVPSLASMNPATVKTGETRSITVTGSDFLPEGMTVVLDPSAGVAAGPPQFISSTEIKFELTASSAAAPGARSLRLGGPTGLSDTSLSLTVTR